MTTTSITVDQADSGRDSPRHTILQAWLQELAAITAERQQPQNRRHVRIWSSNGKLELFDCARHRQRPVAFDRPGEPQPDGIPWRAVKDSLSRSRLSGRPIVLWLGDDRVLVKTLRLPAEATSVLEPILRNQMRRLSPWPEDETLFGFRAGEADRAGSDIPVEVVVAHRPTIDELRQTAAAARLDIAAVCHATNAQSQTSVAIHSTDNEVRDQAAKRIKWMMAMLLAAAVGLGAVGYYGLYEASRMQAQLDGTINNAKARVAEIRRQAKRQRAIAERQKMLIEKKSTNPPAVWVLNALSQAVPDHSWLNRFTFQNNAVELAGTSTNSAALIPALEAAGTFKDVRFSGPTTRNPNTSRESFSVSAVVKFTGLDEKEK